MPRVINKDGSLNATAVVYLYNATGFCLAYGNASTWPKSTLEGKLRAGLYFQFAANASMWEFQLRDEYGYLGAARLG